MMNHEDPQQDIAASRDKDRAALPCPESTQDANAASNASDVWSILSSVESQLDQLKSFERRHADNQQALLAREQKLAEAEAAVQREQAAVNDAQQAIDADRNAVDQERAALSAREEESRQAIDQRQRELDEARGALDQERSAIESANTELIQLRAAFDEQMQESNAQATRAHELAAQRSGELDEREQTIAELEQELCDREAGLRDAEADLNTREQELETARQSLDEERAKRDELLAAHEAHLQQREGEVADRSDQLDHAEERLRKDTSAFRSQHDAFQAQRESMERERTQLFELLSAALEREIDPEDGIETVIEDVMTIASDLSARTIELEAARTEIASLTVRSDALQGDCDAAQELASAAEAERAALRDQLSIAHHETEEKLSELHQKRDELAQRVEQLEAQLELANTQLRQAAEKLAARDETIRKLKVRVDEQMAGAQGATNAAPVPPVPLAPPAPPVGEISSAAGEGADSTTPASSLHAQLDALQQEVVARSHTIADLQQQLADAQAAADRASEQACTLRDELSAQQSAHQAREDELQHQLEDAERERVSLELRLEELTTGQEGGRPSSMRDSKAIDDLRRKARRLAEVSDHLRCRHRRLKIVRELLKERAIGIEATSLMEDSAQTKSAAASANLEQYAAEKRKLEKQRHELAELNQTLVIAEKRMVRRWARPKAVVTVGWLIIIALISGAASWVATSQIFPALVSGSATLEAKSGRVGPIPAEELAGWQDWHLELLQSPDFHKQVAKRMSERRVERYHTPQLVEDRIARDLTVDTTMPERLTLTLAGTDRGDIITFLDILTTTAAAESTRQLRKRNGDTWATVVGEREVRGGATCTAINHTPIRDDRLMYAGPIFGISYGLLLVFIGVLYVRLLRVKREFDSDGTLFESGPVAATP